MFLSSMLSNLTCISDFLGIYIYLFIKIAKSLVPPGEFTKIQRAIRNSQMLQPLDSDGKMDESGVFSRSNPMESYGKTMEKPWEHGDLYGKSPFLMGNALFRLGHGFDNYLCL